MIQIDKPMPPRCAECPCYGDRLYGKCQVTGQWLEDKEGSWFANERPNWCPLKEIIMCDDCKHNDRCELRDLMLDHENGYCADGERKCK